MADPKIENGYTPIANELLEQVYKLKLNGTQSSIIMVVWRFTYGYSRKEHALSETFIAKATEIHKKQISRELNKLIQLNIIRVERTATFTESRIVSFNKDYTKWCIKSREATKTLPPSKLVNATPNELVTTTGSENVTQENNNIKQNIKQKNIVAIPKSEPINHVFEESSFEMQCVETIIRSCLELYPNSKVPTTYKEKEKWANEIEKMKRIDKRTEEEIEKALNFAVDDDFWKKNIRSTKKFREKFETLIIQSNRNRTSGYSRKESFDTFEDAMKGWMENE